MSEDDVNLSDRLRRGIEEDILTGRLRPGDRLDERLLAERHEVSRTPVREALLQLSSIGLVTARPRQGCVVTPLSLNRLLQMVEMMSFTEALAAQLAARRMTQAQRDELQRIQERAVDIIRALDLAAFSDLNWQLHLAIFRGSGNEFLEEQARALRLRLHPYRRLLLRISGRMPMAHDEHGKIVDAIVRGEPDVAFAAMAAHLSLDATRLADIAAMLPEHGVGRPSPAEAERPRPRRTRRPVEGGETPR